MWAILLKCKALLDVVLTRIMVKDNLLIFSFKFSNILIRKRYKKYIIGIFDLIYKNGYSVSPMKTKKVKNLGMIGMIFQRIFIFLIDANDLNYHDFLYF
jgi:hypothetical protein